MNQVGFDDILEGSLVFANRSREGFQSDRPPPEFLDQRRQKRTIQPV